MNSDSHTPRSERRRSRVSSVEQLEQYVGGARRRQSVRTCLQAAAIILLGLAVLTASGVILGLTFGYTPTVVNSVRILFALALFIGVTVLVWQPLSRLQADRGVNLVESADAAFNDRVRTYMDNRDKSANQSFLPLLARDALSVARRVPLSRVVPLSSILLPVLALLAMGLAAVSFIDRGHENWRQGAKHLWWGWREPGLVETRLVAVLPGNTEILSGDNLEIEIALFGFERDSVTLHATDALGDWQQTELSADSDGQFRFTVFRVDAPLEYYVKAAFNESQVYTVEVVEPARLERLTAEYTYPEWTQLETRVDDNASNLEGVLDTRIALSFTTDKALEEPVLVVGSRRINLDPPTVAEGGVSMVYATNLTLVEDSHYQLFDRVLDRDVAITPQYAISLRGDTPPEVRFTAPGRDVSASPIEEVLVAVDARDDFAIESIELLYSVNAGDWLTQELTLSEEGAAEYVFPLESLGLADDGTTPAPMVPGDLVSYYVRVRDHDNVTETDMMLVDVRPFDRRFSEGQGGGGGGGGGGGAANEGSEISQRQKEILVATWNLQRSVETAGGDTVGMEDNASLLAELQRTLADQARTLADRSERRELVNQGEEIREFVRYLREAADAMEPSAVALEALDFDDAIQPQQLALQLLQRAEALFADIRMTRQQADQGGGGGQAGQDMAEMFDLEMDLERNQYEQPDRGGSQGAADQLDDIFEELAELARREELQAERARQQQTTAREERWQRQQLERDLERLQRELEELEQQAENATGAESEALQEAAAQAAEQLQRARDALEREQAAADTELADGGESTESAANGSDAADADAEPGEGQDQAGDALQEALRGLNQARSRDLVAALEAAAATAERLLEEQRDTEFELRQMQERSQDARSRGRSSGVIREATNELAQRKSILQTELEQVRTEVEQLIDRFGDEAPRIGKELQIAVERLDESRAAFIIGNAADRLALGRFVTLLPGESLATNALREWRDRLVDAAATAPAESLGPNDNENRQRDEALDRLRDLRLAMNGEGGGLSGEQGSREQGEGQQGEGQQGEGQQGERQQGEGQQGEGQQGEGQQGEGQQGEGQQGEGQQGEGQQGRGQQGEGQQGRGQQGQGDDQQGEGGGQRGPASSGSQGNGQSGGRDGAQRAIVRNSAPLSPEDTVEALDDLVPELQELGIPPSDLDSLRASADALRLGDSGINQARLDEEYRNVLRLLEQLELGLADNTSPSAVAVETQPEAAEVSESAAEYYRQLSETPRRATR